MTSPRLATALLVLLLLPRPASADWDVSIFAGRAFPTSDDRLILRVPAIPPIQGLDIEASGTPELRADGGPVIGGAVAWEAGVIGIEGRMDLTNVDLDLAGARYNLRVSTPPLGLIGSVTIGDGRFEVDTLSLLSLNLRLRTPGPVGLVVSGGLSYLPAFDIAGSVPLQFELGGVSTVPGTTPRFQLRVAPAESDHRIGVNGGAGLRVGGPVALFAEARAFYFKEYELSVALEDAPSVVATLFNDFDPVRFRPVIINATAGLVFSF
jgi:hypothetical protein